MQTVFYNYSNCNEYLIQKLIFPAIIFSEGEKFSRRGTLEGGFNAENQSRLGFQKKIWEKQEKLEKEEQDLIILKNQINDIDGQLTRIKNELQNSETTKDQLRYKVM